MSIVKHGSLSSQTFTVERGIYEKGRLYLLEQTKKVTKTQVNPPLLNLTGFFRLVGLPEVGSKYSEFFF